MFKKIGKYLLSLALVFVSIFGAVGCDKDKDPSASSYTVTEEEWKINFNLTGSKEETQSLNATQLKKISEITSYTLYAEGENGTETGTSLLKVAPNGMSIEFKLGNVLREEESGTYENDHVLYKSLTKNIKTYFPFGDNYDDFTFDEDKKAYVAEDLTSMMVGDYDPSQLTPVYTKSAEVKFVDGYLKTITVQMCDATFTDIYASFVFTFSNINNTTVDA